MVDVYNYIIRVVNIGGVTCGARNYSTLAIFGFRIQAAGIGGVVCGIERRIRGDPG